MPRVEIFEGGARCVRGAQKPLELWISRWVGDAAARRAQELLARGRTVRFRFVLREDGHTLEAHDADPWAAGWQIYGARLAWQRWAPILIAGAGVLASWLVLRNKLPTTTTKEPTS